MTTHLGRLEPRLESNPAADELAAYLGKLTTRIDTLVYKDLLDIAKRHRSIEVFVEKAVDVMIAVDLVLMAMRDEYDAAYLLSADGDYTPAVKAVRALGKKVYAASPGYGAQLKSVANAFIRLEPEWFNDCI